MKHNIILNTDSYKTSHWVQYPANTENVFSYIESRGGEYDKTIVHGMQAYLKQYLMQPITQEDIDQGAMILALHGVPFNKEGWEYILHEHGGKLPVRIKAVPEGTIVNGKNVLVTIEATDPKCYWLVSYLETSMLRAIWYPSTVATVSWRIKQIIKRFMEETGGDMAGLPFMLHDFGSRGVSSFESSGIGGAAHLIAFQGTDNIPALTHIMENYPSKEFPGFSIPAAEHSTITSWGRENEAKAYSNMIEQYKDNGIMAVVSDSYDIFHAADVIWGQMLKTEVLKSNAIVVIRPDSGNPPEVVGKLLNILAARFGFTKNDKGYKLLNNVRIIQGDGINEHSIVKILEVCKSQNFSAANLAFGMGGALLQHMDRDTMQWAMKCSAMKIDGEWKDVYKDPVGDTAKRSKRGRITLVWDEEHREHRTVRIENVNTKQTDVMKLVFEDGVMYNETTFDEIRVRATAQD